MFSFGIVSEGITDQIVIENILFGFFNNPDLVINYLLPLRDETDENRMEKPSNWVEVFEYCASTKLKQEIQANDFLIIQIDTDVLLGDSISEKYKIFLKNEMSTPEIIEQVKNKCISLITEEFYRTYAHKIIFGISVHSIECWLLPIYFSNQTSKANKTVNCLKTLNEVLPQKEDFYIDKKEPKYYRKISKYYKKQKNLFDSYILNPSLQIFVEEVKSKTITLT